MRLLGVIHYDILTLYGMICYDINRNAKILQFIQGFVSYISLCIISKGQMSKNKVTTTELHNALDQVLTIVMDSCKKEQLDLWEAGLARIDEYDSLPRKKLKELRKKLKERNNGANRVIHK